MIFYQVTKLLQVYSVQLKRLAQPLREKEPALISQNGVILHHHNARPHTAKITAGKLRHSELKVILQLQIFLILPLRLPFVLLFENKNE